MKKYLLLFSLFISIQGYSQSGIADNWFFGVFCGMKFSAVSTGAIPSMMYTTEGCSGISDSSGVALFYTDGTSVWDNTGQVMPNGTGLMGDPSTTQSALIVPDPSNNLQYYIFTLDADGGPDGLRYSIVDMTLNNGHGDITVKNTLLQNDVTERITAVRNPAQGGYWVVIHENNTDAFYSYHLTSAGLSTPVISNVGIVHSSAAIQNSYGQMKFNTCGTMLAVACGYLNTVEIFHFDMVTGILSNPISLPMTDHVYGLEFSIDGRYLYITCYDPGATLIQFDLSAGNASAVLASQVVLSTIPDLYGLQLANNEKIYVCKAWGIYMGAVEFPSLGGLAASYVDTSVFLDPNSTGASASLGLPGFVTSMLGEKQPCFTTAINESTEDQIISIAPNPSSSEFSISVKYNDSNFYIYDCTGRIVEQQSGLSPGNFQFGSRLDQGLYRVVVLSGDKTMHAQAVKL